MRPSPGEPIEPAIFPALVSKVSGTAIEPVLMSMTIACIDAGMVYRPSKDSARDDAVRSLKEGKDGVGKPYSTLIQLIVVDHSEGKMTCRDRRSGDRAECLACTHVQQVVAEVADVGVQA